MTFGKTGEKCLVPGKYRCFGNNNKRIFLCKDEVFPKPETDHEGIWILTSKEEPPHTNSSETYQHKL